LRPRHNGLPETFHPARAEVDGILDILSADPSPLNRTDGRHGGDSGGEVAPGVVAGPCLGPQTSSNRRTDPGSMPTAGYRADCGRSAGSKQAAGSFLNAARRCPAVPVEPSAVARGGGRPLRRTKPRSPMLRNHKGGVPTRREMLQILKYPRVDPKEPNDPSGAPVQPVSGHCDCPGPSIGREMLKRAGKAGSHNIFRRQHGQKTEEADANPRQEPK
jgi:hypothetical protein